MESRSKVFGHALHQSMVVLPLDVLIMAVAFDIVGAVLGSADWHRAAFWMIGAGVVTGVAAALPGIWDWIAIPMGTRAKTIGLFHGLGNIAVIALFAIAWLMRKGSGDPAQTDGISLTLEIIAFALGGLTAWLGGEMVGRLGVGVDRGANLNAPNSLTKRPATDTPDPVVAP